MARRHDLEPDHDESTHDECDRIHQHHRMTFSQFLKQLWQLDLLRGGQRPRSRVWAFYRLIRLALAC